MIRPALRARPGCLDGMRAVVTGGSGAIGAATARVFAAHGARVAITGRDMAAPRSVAAGTGAAAIQADPRDPSCPRQVVEAAVEALGGLDVTVSDAGIGWSGAFATMAETDIDALLDVNLRAAAHLASAALPYLRPGVGRRPARVGVSLVSLGVVPHEGQHSRPMSVQEAAGAIADAVLHRRDDVAVPQLPSLPARVMGTFPGLYRLLAACGR